MALFFQYAAEGVFFSVFSVFHVDALDFRGEAGEGVDAVYQVHEVMDGGFGPPFSGVDAEDARGIGEGAFEGDAAFCVF